MLLPARRLAALSMVALFAAAAGCELVAGVDPGPSTAASSSSSSTGAGGAGGSAGAGGTGGAPAQGCTTDVQCPGETRACGHPRCFPDGLCGFENLPIGAACDEAGGHACNGKGACVECTSGVHCASGRCAPDHTCLPPTCSDGLQNGDETDTDCGGSCAARCAPGAACVLDADCAGGACSAGTCAPTCTDGAKNGAETDTDCGGPACPACALGAACVLSTDCASGLCDASVCVPIPTCTDGAKNGAETDIDCGGPDCPRCADGAACAAGTDCVSGACAAGLCAAPSCSDGVQNGGEIGVDCGAACPGKGCAPGTSCGVAADCDSKVCAGPPGGMACAAPSCFDGVINGGESSWDCGGPCEAKCPYLYGCFVGADCIGGLCDPVKKTCAATCTDGLQNGTETDPDCGGTCPQRCGNGHHCSIDGDCQTGLACFYGHCCPIGQKCCADGICPP